MNFLLSFGVPFLPDCLPASTSCSSVAVFAAAHRRLAQREHRPGPAGLSRPVAVHPPARGGAGGRPRAGRHPPQRQPALLARPGERAAHGARNGVRKGATLMKPSQIAMACPTARARESIRGRPPVPAAPSRSETWSHRGASASLPRGTSRRRSQSAMGRRGPAILSQHLGEHCGGCAAAAARI